MASPSLLLEKGNAATFEKVLELYPQAIQAKADSKSKDKEMLLTLDKWYQNELGPSMMTRKPPFMKHEELVKLMKWKLARGKWRPRLVDFAGSNAEELIKKVSTEAFHLAEKSKIEGAIRALSKLKGVGPATASGVLAAGVPGRCAFFADEVAMAIPDLGPIKYTVEEYIHVNETLKICATRLNKEREGDEEKCQEWTPHRVELAIWTLANLQKFKPDTVSDIFIPAKVNGAKEEEVNPKRRKKE
ncbi:uncharacterized protein LOC143029821 isoform X2 [Oratosquilla oratoria]|uniref:uncharacterized protein LOC143029821 isoform X2 n=1 Tax=Oratosquilla oratoria TaxID=337810 RepID=UPI003F76C4CA